jgi:hypothetical protein
LSLITTTQINGGEVAGVTPTLTVTWAALGAGDITASADTIITAVTPMMWCESTTR